MWHHTFDKELEDRLCFVWSEANKNDDAFLAHLAYPGVGVYLKEYPKLANYLKLRFMERLVISVFNLYRGACVPFKVFPSKLGLEQILIKLVDI